MMKELLSFLDNYYIDSEYYLNEEARGLYDKELLDLREIEKLDATEYIKYLDLRLLQIEVSTIKYIEEVRKKQKNV